MLTRGQRRLAKTQKINTLASEISTRTHFTTDDVDENEFIVGLSSMLRGDLNELIDFCYFVYDINGDKSLAREELFQCLKGCIVSGFGVDADDVDDAEKDVVEIVMRKLDVNKDGQITFDDFQNAVHADPLLVQSIGPCLPTPENTATFQSTITEHYRAYAGCWTDTVEKEKEKERARSKRRQSRGEFLGGGQNRENRFTTAARATHAPVGRATHVPPGRATVKSRTTQKETLQPASVSAKASSVKKA